MMNMFLGLVVVSLSLLPVAVDAGNAPERDRHVGPVLLEKIRPLYPDIQLQRGDGGEAFFSSVEEVARVPLEDGTERLVVRARIIIPAAVDRGNDVLLFFRDADDAEPMLTLSLMVPPTRLVEGKWLQFEPEQRGTLVSLVDEESLKYLSEHGPNLLMRGLSVCAARDALKVYLEQGRDAFLEAAPIRQHREPHVRLPDRIRSAAIYPSLVEEMRYSRFKYSDAWEATLLVRLTPADEAQAPVILEIGGRASSAGIECDDVELLLWETRAAEPLDRPLPPVEL